MQARGVRWCALTAVVGAVASASLAAAASSADVGPGFAVQPLSYPGSEPLQWPSLVADGTGKALALSQGPVAWTTTGSGWSAGQQADPARCRGTDAVGAPTTGAVVDQEGTTTWFAAQMCVASGFSLQVDRSTDGVHWDTDGSAAIALAGVDGGFLSAGPDGTLYADGHLEGPDFSALVVSRSDDGGRTFGSPVLVNRSASGFTSGCAADLGSVQTCTKQNIVDQSANTPTQVFVDPRDPNRLYLAWTAVTPADFPGGGGILNPWEHATKAFIARSDDGGATWTQREILDIGSGSFVTDPNDENDLENWFPTGAVGRDGTVYVAFSRRGPDTTESHVQLMSSSDGGETWTAPQTLDRGLGSTFAPRLAVEEDGGVDVAFYGSAAADETSPDAVWSVYVDHVPPTGGGASVDQELVEPDIHSGALCPQATSSGGSCTDVAHMTIGLAASSDDQLLVTYVDDEGAAPVMHVAVGPAP